MQLVLRDKKLTTCIERQNWLNVETVQSAQWCTGVIGLLRLYEISHDKSFLSLVSPKLQTPESRCLPSNSDSALYRVIILVLFSNVCYHTKCTGETEIVMHSH